MGFHSINVPSEWGLLYALKQLQNLCDVSIQLMSPASGDLKLMNVTAFMRGFHSINVPSEWGLLRDKVLILEIY